MANLAQAFAGGFESGQAIGDTIVADRDLKQAQSESGPGADLYTTYQKAGQMAMQSGNTRVADKFLKQANEYKGDALKTKLAEMTVHHAEVSDFERTIRANDNPDSLKAAISSSDKLNPQEKLEYTGLVDKAQKSGKWDEFHKAIGQSTETYKEQQATQIAILKEQLAEQKVLFDMNYKSEKLRIDAGKSAGKPSPAEKRASAMEDWKTKRGIVQEEAIEGRRATALKELKTKPYFGKKSMDERETEINEIYDAQIDANMKKYLPKEDEDKPINALKDKSKDTTKSPKKGDVKKAKDGTSWKYKGGDPSKETSWEKV